MAQIVIMGAGIGGMPMAYELREQCRPEDKIVVISDSDYFHFDCHAIRISQLSQQTVIPCPETPCGN